ncbi:claudin-2 [Denticeps clupeoides]|uniref:Claudin n=1 Tax=Denticeps clupeoides TaxID=299321 RepID=A0AAY4EBX8_9TELE|nr:claudin-2-like [Denticeps clupeoides]XP_028840107.1 claudin-2-like [Denticeps clupeoides]XP_028840108.1 claudin-2-like [Denticeps clupeoides]XP_028840109.1 claudin-2-like [Denticeps clupeoides]
MAIMAVELLGFFLGLLGMIGTLTVTLLPYWEISSHIGANIVTAVVNMRGLWMECVYQSTGAFQCETYNTILGLRTDLQAARAMMVISIIFSTLACAISSLGMQCTVCLDGSSGKVRVAGVGGGLFMTAGLLALIPVAWKTHNVVQTFYSLHLPDSLKYELGDCLYAGIASSLLSMLGGGLLSISCCDEVDGVSAGRGMRRHGGNYPYPAGAGAGVGTGGGRWGSHTVPYRSGTLQSGMNPPAAAPADKLAKAHSHSQASSSHSGSPAAPGSKKSPRQHVAAGYDVTGKTLRREK